MSKPVLNNLTVTVITVSYNSSAFIYSAIESVSTQGYDNVEYIIIDGNSSDNTVSIIRSYGDKVTKLISEPDKGIYDAMNKGLSLASGDIIGILNSDDFYPSSDVISHVAGLFAENPSADMVLGNVDFVKATDLDKPVRFYSSFYFSPWKLRFGFMPAHPAAFIKRSAYEKVGSYALGYKIGADFEWFVRALLLCGLTYRKTNRTLVRMREGGVSTSGLKSYWLSSKEQLRALKANGVYSNIFFVLLRLPFKFFQKLIRKN